MKHMKNLRVAAVLAAILAWAATGAQPVKPCFKGSKRLQAPYGVCAHFTFFGHRGDYDTFREQSRLLSSMGCNIVRYDIAGKTINESNTGTLDEILPVMKDYGLESLPILFDHRLMKTGWSEADKKFESDVETIRRHYLPELRYIEFHNEVNFSKLPSVGRHYAEDLRRLHSLKRSNRKLKILFSGLADCNYEFLDSAMSHGAYKYIDIMNFHSYRTPEDIPTFMGIIRDNMERYHWSKPVWLTECGMYTAEYDLSETNRDFFVKVVPQALRHIGLGMAGIGIGVMNDTARAYYSLNGLEVKEYISDLGAKPVYLTLDDLRNVSPAKVPVIVLTAGESFYSEFFPAVLSYVARGGTLVLPCGAPFYYDASDGGKLVGRTYADLLHIGQLYWWNDEARRLRAPEHPTFHSPNDDFGVSYSFGGSPRYLTADKLADGDTMTPISFAGDENYKGAVAALYQLNSDLKGNIIIQTRTDSRRLVDLEDEQARRIARLHIISYAHGVDKVFVYESRSPEVDKRYSEDCYGIFHGDLSPKPAVGAYRTLVRMLPDGSSRPRMSVDGGNYTARWRKPDGTPVTAMWRAEGLARIPMPRAEKCAFYDYMGNRIYPARGGVVEVSSGVVFVLPNGR